MNEDSGYFYCPFIYLDGIDPGDPGAMIDGKYTLKIDVLDQIDLSNIVVLPNSYPTYLGGQI